MVTQAFFFLRSINKQRRTDSGRSLMRTPIDEKQRLVFGVTGVGATRAVSGACSGIVLLLACLSGWSLRQIASERAREMPLVGRGPGSHHNSYYKEWLVIGAVTRD